MSEPRNPSGPRRPSRPGDRRPGGPVSGRTRGAAGAKASGGRRLARTATQAAGPKPSGSGDRIAKLLARSGVGSRRDIERMIADGRVALNGTPLTTPATILTSLNGVTVDGKPVSEADSTRIFLFHKPAGVLTAARDPGGRPTIYDVLPAELPRLMPVGRLDLNTEGLLLLTNDGELKRALELPASEVPRTYRVRAMGKVTAEHIERLAMGMTVEGVRYGSIDASVDRRASVGGANIWLTMTLTEGKNREVRRVCEAIGLKVSRLIRVGYGPYLLGDIPVRGVVEAPSSTIGELRRMLKKRPQTSRPA